MSMTAQIAAAAAMLAALGSPQSAVLAPQPATSQQACDLLELSLLNMSETGLLPRPRTGAGSEAASPLDAYVGFSQRVSASMPGDPPCGWLTADSRFRQVEPNAYSLALIEHPEEVPTLVFVSEPIFLLDNGYRAEISLLLVSSAQHCRAANVELRLLDGAWVASALPNGPVGPC
jgi:hypothetical protein